MSAVGVSASPAWVLMNVALIRRTNVAIVALIAIVAIIEALKLGPSLNY